MNTIATIILCIGIVVLCVQNSLLHRLVTKQHKHLVEVDARVEFIEHVLRGT
jgi:hypothetical protein